MGERSIRVSITIPEKLLAELDDLIARSFRSRSQAVAEAIRLLLEYSREDIRGPVIGLITYRFKGHHAAERLRELGHQYLDVVVSTLHVHASRDECLEALVVKGETDRVLKLVEDVRRIKGVKSVSRTLITLTQGLH